MEYPRDPLVIDLRYTNHRGFLQLFQMYVASRDVWAAAYSFPTLLSRDKPFIRTPCIEVVDPRTSFVVQAEYPDAYHYSDDPEGYCVNACYIACEQQLRTYT